MDMIEFFPCIIQALTEVQSQVNLLLDVLNVKYKNYANGAPIDVAMFASNTSFTNTLESLLRKPINGINELHSLEPVAATRASDIQPSINFSRIGG